MLSLENLGHNLTVQTTQTVIINNTLVVYQNGGAIELDVKISADLEKVPAHLREVFLNVLTSKYLSSVSFQDNPFSECKKKKSRNYFSFLKKIF